MHRAKKKIQNRYNQFENNYNFNLPETCSFSYNIFNGTFCKIKLKFSSGIAFIHPTLYFKHITCTSVEF